MCLASHTLRRMVVLMAIDLCALLGGFQYPVWPIDKEVSGTMFYGNHRPINFENYEDKLCFFLQALERWGILHWGIEAYEDVGRCAR
jgi:hypothetical protein